MIERDESKWSSHTPMNLLIWEINKSYHHCPAAMAATDG